MKELALSLGQLNAVELETREFAAKDSSERNNLRHRFVKTSVSNGNGWIRSNESDNSVAEAAKNSSEASGESKAGAKNEEDANDEENRIVQELTSVFNGHELPEAFHDWTANKQISWIMENISVTRNVVPKSLHYLTAAIFRPGDCGRSPLEKPDWLDMDKFRRGQKFGRDHFFNVNLANIFGLYQLFSFKEGIDSIIFTKRSNTPYLSFKRYLSTALRIRNWCTSDPWEEGSPAYKDMLAVRRMHKALKLTFEKMDNEAIAEMCKIDAPCCPMLNIIQRDFQAACSEPTPGQCPYRVVHTLPNKPKGMNQGDMSSTQFAFVGTVVLYPRSVGIHNATDEDLEAYCHTWRAIGYLLGIEDEFNFCRGTLEEIQQRTKDFTEYWIKPNFRIITPEWEHMIRCLMVGIEYYFPSINFELGLLHLADCLQVDLPHVYASLGYVPWMLLHLSKWFLQYACKSQLVGQFMNHRINDALDRAAVFSPEKHAELQAKSAEWMKLMCPAVHT